MLKGMRRELSSLMLFLPLGIVSVLVVFLLVGSGMAGSGGLFESPIPSPVGEATVGPSILPPLIAVRTRPNYLPWLLGGLVIIGGVVGVRLYRRGRGDEG